MNETKSLSLAEHTSRIFRLSHHIMMSKFEHSTTQHLDSLCRILTSYDIDIKKSVMAPTDSKNYSQNMIALGTRLNEVDNVFVWKVWEGLMGPTKSYDEICHTLACWRELEAARDSSFQYSEPANIQ